MPGCKVDDLVLIIKAKVKENIGKHATVKQYAGVFEGERLWLCEAPEPIRTLPLDPKGNLREVITPFFYALDSWLIPIKGPSVDEDLLKEDSIYDEGTGVVHYSGCEIVR